MTRPRPLPVLACAATLAAAAAPSAQGAVPTRSVLERYDAGSPAAETSAPGTLLWRFPIAYDFLENPPTVGPDGTIYASDWTGRLYAVRPDGSEKWTVDALRGQAGNADEGPVAVFADGTVLVATNPLGAPTELVAYTSGGSLKWVRTFTESISWFAGPSIGLDGHAYAAQSGPTAQDQVLSVDSEGNLLWSVRAQPDLYEENPVGTEIGFVRDGADDVLAFHCDQNLNGRLFTFDADDGSQGFTTPVSSVSSYLMQAHQSQVATDSSRGRIYMTGFAWGSAGWAMRAFDAEGTVLWTYDPTMASEASAPAVGPDGTIFVAWDLNYLGAVEPEGSERWQIFDDLPIREQPTVSPGGSTLIVVGGPFGASGRIEAFDATNGASLWEAPFTLPAAGTVYPSGRPVFSQDGSAVYAGSSVFSGSVNGSFLYAFATGEGSDDDGVRRVPRGALAPR